MRRVTIGAADHMSNMSYGKGDRLMRVVSKQYRRRMIPSDTDCILSMTSCLCLMQPAHKLAEHHVHTLQVLHLHHCADHSFIMAEICTINREHYTPESSDAECCRPL